MRAQIELYMTPKERKNKYLEVGKQVVTDIYLFQKKRHEQEVPFRLSMERIDLQARRFKKGIVQ